MYICLCMYVCSGVIPYDFNYSKYEDMLSNSESSLMSGGTCLSSFYKLSKQSSVIICVAEL